MPKRSKGISKRKGGFNDLASFRAETGLTQADISDHDAMRVIVEDRDETVRANQREIERLKQEKQQLADRQSRMFNYDNALQTTELRRQKDLLEHKLETEKAKARLLKGIIDPYNFGYDPVDTAYNYVRRKAREEEEARERRDKKKLLQELGDIWREDVRPRRKTKTKTRSRSQSKSRSRSRPKSKTKSKSKSKKK